MLLIKSKSLTKSLFDIASSWAIIISSLVLAFHVESLFIKIVCFFVISSRQYSLLLLMHDGIHGALCSSKKINDFLGEYILSYPLGALFLVGRERHSAHHHDFGKENDPDKKFYFTKDSRQSNFVSHLKKTILFLIFNYAILKKKIESNDDNKPAHSQKSKGLSVFLKMVLYQSLIWIILWAITGQWSFYLLYWFLPIVNFAVLLDKFRLFCEHTPYPESENQEILTRHFKSNPIERFFLAPMHANFHVEHHLLPGVCHRNLPLVRKTIFPYDRDAGFVTEESYVGFYIRHFIMKRFSPPEGTSSKTS